MCDNIDARCNHEDVLPSSTGVFMTTRLSAGSRGVRIPIGRVNLPPFANRRRLDAVKSHPSTVDVQKEWSYTSTSIDAFMT